eukprot:IDg3898t1
MHIRDGIDSTARAIANFGKTRDRKLRTNGRYEHYSLTRAGLKALDTGSETCFATCTAQHVNNTLTGFDTSKNISICSTVEGQRGPMIIGLRSEERHLRSRAKRRSRRTISYAFLRSSREIRLDPEAMCFWAYAVASSVFTAG